MNSKVYFMGCAVVLLLTAAKAPAGDMPVAFRDAIDNSQVYSMILSRTHANMMAWLGQRDAGSGLLPRLIHKRAAATPQSAHYMVKDTAADLYPFLVLTAFFSDRELLSGYLMEFLRREIELTTAADGLPRDYFFNPGRQDEKDLEYNIFGASEYAKDGLTPVVEWMGRTPWLQRMIDLTEAIYRNLPIHTNFGPLPSGSAEVNGNLLQTLCRLYGITRDVKYLQWAESIGDAYCFEVLKLNSGLPAHTWDFSTHEGSDFLNLRDHGCEIIGGLALLFCIENDEERSRAKSYYWPIKQMLDRLSQTVNEDGQFPNRIHCQDLTVIQGPLNDNWGYLYTAWWDFYLATGETRYRDLIAHALTCLPKYRNAEWERNPADGFADSIEGALEMINRIPSPVALDWIDSEIQNMLALQQKEGYIEGWYGDGNWNRTALMYMLLKTQGCFLWPWDGAIQMGAASNADTLYLALKTRAPWRGRLYFDHPRHADIFNFKANYARINEFPEWFTVSPLTLYNIDFYDSQMLPLRRLGGELQQGLELDLKKNNVCLLRVYIHDKP